MHLIHPRLHHQQTGWMRKTLCHLNQLYTGDIDKSHWSYQLLVLRLEATTIMIILYLLLHGAKLLRWLYPNLLSRIQWHSCTVMKRTKMWQCSGWRLASYPSPIKGSLVPRPHPQEGKGSGDFGPFAWLDWLWLRMPTRSRLNKARIWLVSKATWAIQIYSEQWRFYIPVVSESYDCAKAAIWLACAHSCAGCQLDQAFCPKSPDLFPPWGWGLGTRLHKGRPGGWN